VIVVCAGAFGAASASLIAIMIVSLTFRLYLADVRGHRNVRRGSEDNRRRLPESAAASLAHRRADPVRGSRSSDAAARTIAALSA